MDGGQVHAEVQTRSGRCLHLSALLSSKWVSGSLMQSLLTCWQKWQPEASRSVCHRINNTRERTVSLSSRSTRTPRLQRGMSYACVHILAIGGQSISTDNPINSMLWQSSNILVISMSETLSYHSGRQVATQSCPLLLRHPLSSSDFPLSSSSSASSSSISSSCSPSPSSPSFSLSSFSLSHSFLCPFFGISRPGLLLDAALQKIHGTFSLSLRYSGCWKADKNMLIEIMNLIHITISKNVKNCVQESMKHQGRSA